MTVLEALGLAYLVCAVIVIGILVYCAGHGEPAWFSQEDPHDKEDW